MDQKHAMLYPPLEQGAPNTMPQDQRNSASAAMGLPTEAPPSYDMAMAAGPSSSRAVVAAFTPGWAPSAPIITPAGAALAQPQSKFAGDPQSSAPSAAAARSVIVQQPHMQAHQPPLPAASPSPLPQQQQQQQQLPTVPAAATGTITTTRVVTAALPPKLGPNPCAVTCPACGSSRTTRMSYTPNTRTHMCALLLCLVGWCCCACCVPYLMTSCRTGNHYCSKCNTFLGTFNPHKHK